MKLIVRLVLSFILLVIWCSFCPAQDNKSSDEPPPPAAFEYVQDNWKDFSPAEGGYAISLPGTPELGKDQAQPAIGKFIQKFYHLNTGAADYTVGYFDLIAQLSDPLKTTKAILDAERQQLLATNKNWKLLSEKKFEVEVGEGRDWLIKDGDKVLRKRYFFSGSRYYQITLSVSRDAAFKTGKPSSNPSDFTDFYQMIATRFFDSFKLTPIKAAAATGESGAAGGVKKTIISGGVINGKAISLPRPDYPAEARAAHVEGTVAVKVLINEEGKVVEAKAVSGPMLLRAAAERAALRGRFSIVKLEGLAVKVSGFINFNFSLQ